MSLPYDYTGAVMYAIDKLAEGLTETRACDEANISTATFKNYIKASEELATLYEEALQRGFDSMADALLQIDDHNTEYGQSDSKMAKVMSDNLKWFLEKKDSKRFGQKVEVNHTLTADRAITQALAAGQQRALAARRSVDEENAIDAEYEEV